MQLALVLALVLTQQAAKDPPRVGRVIVIGNTITQQSVILGALTQLQPGQLLDDCEVATGKARLVQLRIFKTVAVQVAHNPENPSSPFKDIIVTVEEGPSSNLRIMAGWARTRGNVPVVSLVWEERNFDPWTWPTCLQDCITGRAFRGGGQVFRLELIQVPLVPAYPVRLLQWGSLLLG
jgi:outer membrane protein assembly factor BamA